MSEGTSDPILIALAPAEADFADIAAAHMAGAALAHLHPRPAEPDVWKDLAARLKEVAPEMAPQMALEGAGLSQNALVDTVRAGRPKLFAARVNELVPDEAGVALDKVKGFARWLDIMRVTPQFVCRTPAEVAKLVRLRGLKFMPWKEPFVLFVPGEGDGTGREPAEALEAFIKALAYMPARWMVAIGADPAALAFKAAVMGGHVMVGGEFGRALPAGGEAASEAELVRASAELLAQAGRRPMTPEEARVFLAEARRQGIDA